MILGIGTDIINVDRICKSIENEAFVKKVFTLNEIAYCNVKVNKAESYAARFAAKEAFSKAVGTGFRGEIDFKEIEVILFVFGFHFCNCAIAYTLENHVF